jgi:iron complex transport system ATP-binding protein
MLTITMEHLTIGYRDKVVARGLEGRVEPGLLTCLLGKNGAGKSTLLRTLAGLQSSLAGRVSLERPDGQRQDVASLGKSQMARLVSVVLTERPHVEQLTVSELVGMGRLPYTGFFGGLNADDRRLVDRSLELTGTLPLARRQVQALSDGELQKVMIAKALAQQTPIILLDEPTAYLDYPSKVDMMTLLGRLAHSQQLTILLSTHDLDLASRLGDRFLRLDGTLQAASRADLLDYLAQAVQPAGRA